MDRYIRNSMLADVYFTLIRDEQLMRLLYLPSNANPFSDEFDNITDLENGSIDEQYEFKKIVDKHVLRTSKSDDLEEEKLCRIYVYFGKTRSSYKNVRTTKQEIVIDVFCHLDYVEMGRMEMIFDRVDELLFNERVKGGLGRINYRDGYDFKAPRDYEAYRHIYEVGGRK